jgi:hypothetical protein
MIRKTFGQNRLGPDWTGVGSQLGEADDLKPIFEPIDVVRAFSQPCAGRIIGVIMGERPT